jgi:MoaA/NifB/PqqE/SkfB family radical SAM enzyme
MSHYEYKTDSGATSLNKESILKFWNSKSREAFIKLMDSGEQIPECSACWNEEQSGKESKRLRDNKNFKDTELDKSMLPLVLDLSMGNLCNIKCRICSPKHSTPWVAEVEKLNPGSIPKLFFQTLTESFDYNNDYFWKDIATLLPNVIKYDFAGGEPFFIEKHWDIVKSAVENNWSKTQHIHYNTNGTIFPSKYINLLEEFQIVDIQISTDGVGKKFEYMRNPAKWSKVENNIQMFLDAKAESKTTWVLGVCISISAFNVYDFFETFEHYASKNDVRIYINIVHDHRGIRVLPLELREIIIKKLEVTNSKFKPGQWEKEKLMICNHLKNSSFNHTDWKNFWKETKMRDDIRNESFEETFPEYYKYMKNFIG